MRTLFSMVFAGFIAAATSATVPPPDTRCVKDSDCATVPFLVTSAGAASCCYECGTSTAGNTTWVSDVNRACTAYLQSQSKSCPKLACVSGFTSAQCKAGQCVLETA